MSPSLSVSSVKVVDVSHFIENLRPSPLPVDTRIISQQCDIMDNFEEPLDLEEPLDYDNLDSPGMPIPSAQP